MKTTLFLSFLLLAGLSACQTSTKNHPAVQWQVDRSLKIDTTMKSESLSAKENLIPFQNKNGLWGYLDAESKAIKIAPKYSDAELFKGKLAKVAIPNPDPKNFEERSLFGWIDTTGKEIFKPQFTSDYTIGLYGGIGNIITKKEDLIPGYRLVITANHQYGIISLIEQKWMVPLGKYHDFYFYTPNCFLAHHHILVVNGKEFPAPKGYYVSDVDLESQLFSIQKDRDSELKGLATWSGQIIAKPQYLDIQYLPKTQTILASRTADRHFFSKLKHAIQTNDKKAGEKLMNQSGRIIVELLNKGGQLITEYPADDEGYLMEGDSIGTFHQGEKSYYFSLKTGKLVDYDYQAVQKDHATFAKNGLVGLKNRQGKTVIPPDYTTLEYFSPDFIIASKQIKGEFDPKYGVINLQEKTVIPFIYNDLEYDPRYHLLNAYKDGKHGLLNTKGEALTPFKYQNGIYFDATGYASVYDAEKYREGIVDTTGKEVIPSDFKTVFATNLNEKNNPLYFTVENDKGLWGMLDTKGDTVIPFQYGFLTPDNEQHLFAQKGWVQTESKDRQKSGLYNIKTGVVIPPTYNSIFPSETYIKAYQYNKKNSSYHYQLLDLQGKPLTSTNYITMDDQKGYFIVQRADNKKNGIMSLSGKVLIPCEYDYIWAKIKDLILVENNGRYYFINIKTKEKYLPMEA